MNINIVTQSGTLPVALEQHINYARQVIWIGAKSEEVYNTITLEGVDLFQCSIAYDKETDTWSLTHGQYRTHCTRGLKSDRSRACSLCRGCCACLRTANPDYSLRIPSQATLLNGVAVNGEAVVLKEGDVIGFR